MEELIIKMGVTDSSAAEMTEQDVRISEVHAHPRYRKVNNEYDLALIKLDAEVKIDDPTTGVYPVCLSPTQTPPTPRQETSGWVAGWGTRYEGQLSVESRLRQVRLPLVDLQTCRRALSQPPRPLPVANHMFCAGFAHGGADACQGDSGGAFVVKTGAVWTQTGIVSWGRGCGRLRQYGVMIDVGHFYDWIVGTIYDG